MKFNNITFGIPKEIMSGERRVAAIPDTVKKMVAEGAKVLVECGAGEGSFFADQDYKAVGAELVADVEEIFNRSDIILKVKEPQFNKTKGKHEVDMMKAGQFLVTFIHPASPVNHEMVKNLTAKGVTALTLDTIPRITRAQSMDALTSMSTVAGYKGVLMAANALSKFMPMTGTAVGMLKPANTLVIGAGVAGLQAIATAKRLGSRVFAADIRPDAREQAASVGAKIVDLSVPAELAIGKGGYARSLPEEWVKKEREELRNQVINSDIIVLTALIPGEIAPILITEEMVEAMAPGSVIVDISIDQGGNCACTKPGEIVQCHGVTIMGIKNIPGMVPTSSTWMFAHNIYNYVANLVQNGELKLNMNDEIIASSLVSVDYKLVHAGARAAMGLK